MNPGSQSPLKGIHLICPPCHDEATPEVSDEELKRPHTPQVRFVQPLRFNWAQYERLEHAWHRRITTAGMMASFIAMVVLGWRMASGDPISAERWFCGAASGLFLAWMVRLALFALLATPQEITFRDGLIHLSGIGSLRPDQILRWSLRRGLRLDARLPACARLEICCHRLGHDHEWTMLVDENADAARLLRLLQERLPLASHGMTRRKPVIEIEAGFLSH